MIADSDIEQTEIMYVWPPNICHRLLGAANADCGALHTHCKIQAPHWAEIIGVFVVPGSAGVCHMPSLSMPSRGAKRGA